jgi:hypothetical protein
MLALARPPHLLYFRQKTLAGAIDEARAPFEESAPKGRLAHVRVDGDSIITQQREIIKGCCVTPPTGYVRCLGANDVGRSAHPHAALTGRPIHKRDFHLDGRSNLEYTGR